MQTLSSKFASLLKYPRNTRVIGEKIKNTWKWTNQNELNKYVNNAVELLQHNNVKSGD